MRQKWICTEVLVWADDSDTLYDLITETLDPMRTIVGPPVREAIIEFQHVEDMVAMKLALSNPPTSMDAFSMKCDKAGLEIQVVPCTDHAALVDEVTRVASGRATVHAFERHRIDFADQEMRDRLDRALAEQAGRFRDAAGSNGC